MANQTHRLTSAAFNAICPGAVFEWHPATGYLTVTRSIPGLPGAVDTVSADVQSHAQAIKCTAAYAQGYAHAKTDIAKLVMQKAHNRAQKIMDGLRLEPKAEKPEDAERVVESVELKAQAFRAEMERKERELEPAEGSQTPPKEETAS
jgi:hypothetical protein